MSILIPIEVATSREAHGGKSANLAFLTRLGLTVPAGRIVPSDEFSRHVTACAGAPSLAEAIASRSLRDELSAELRALVTELGGRVSVRSSATLEDAKTHSFAGQFLTVLNVGADGVDEAVRRVWASAFTDNVTAYLRRGGLDAAKLRMAVVVQRQIDSRASGVAMGRRGGVIVEAVFGQGESLVSGEVTVDHWEVEGGRIVSTAIATKATRRVLSPGAPTGELVREDVPAEERGLPSLTEAQVLEVAEVCARIAAAAEGRPQDCEFAYADGRLHLLQTRDVTASLPVTAPPLPAFAPPGKGAWELDGSHFRHPATSVFQELFPIGMMAGFKKAAERYGAFLSHVEIRFVNGFAYAGMRLVAAPEDATVKPPPPAWLFKLLCKVVPALRRRTKAAGRTFADRIWRQQVEEWKTTKARAVEVHQRLQSVDLDALDEASLLAHLRTVREHVIAMVEQHHTYNLAVLLPAGDLMAHVKRWSSNRVTDAEICALMTGASPISADLRSPEAKALGTAVLADEQARRLLRIDEDDAYASDDRLAAALRELRTLDSEAGRQAREFLSFREYRLVEGLDPGAPCLHECPSVLWQAVRSATQQARKPEPSGDEQQRASLEQVRAAVPAEHHAELDALIAEARASAFLRDERALFSDIWAWGILRTTILAIGRRLIRRSPALLVQADDLSHASFDEITSLLQRSVGPSATELEMRAAYRRAYTVADAPPLLGPHALPPPSLDLFPPAVARLTAAVMSIMTHVITAPAASDDSATLHGCAASGGSWEGLAHVVNSHDDAKDIPPGAVLVVASGSSSFTLLAPLASAVVAEGGGLLSHVAIVCREYRIPCVCGCPSVLTTLHNGSRLRVDGTRGTVEVLEAAAV